MAGLGGYPGYGEIRHFRRPGVFGGAEFLNARFGRFDFTRHAHDRVSFGLVTEGRFRIDRPGGSVIAGTGEVILFNHDLVHWGGSAGAPGWSIRTLYADPAQVHDLASDLGLGGRGTVGFTETVVCAPALGRRLLALHRTVEAGATRLEADGDTLEVLTGLIARYSDRRGSLSGARREPRAVKEAKAHLEAQVCDDVSLQDLARVAGLSPSRLVRVFKAALGLPPHAYHGYLKVRRAQALLRSGLPVAETAVACGFHDQAHLTRVFKRHAGVTPGRFRAA